MSISRRAFITALLGTAAAVALPLDALIPAASPKWLEQAATLTIGDVFRIEGVYALNPLTRQPTGVLQYFVLAEASPPVVCPRLFVDGPYANCSNLPAPSAALLPARVGETIPTTVTWLNG